MSSYALKISKIIIFTWIGLFILSTISIVTSKINKIHYEEEINNLEQKVILRDQYIINITTTYKPLYEHCIVEDEVRPIVHYIDSIGFDFFNETKLLDYGVFAMDVCDYYDRIYYNMINELDYLKTHNE